MERTRLARFSLMRFMSRSWGKNVMKSLFPNFLTRICDLIKDFQSRLYKLADGYEVISKEKNFHLKVKREYCFDNLTLEILKQGLLSILDMSVNELNVRMLNNSLLNIETFYLQMELAIINISKEFMHDMIKKYPIKTFTAVSLHY